MTFEDVLARLRPYKGQFHLVPHELTGDLQIRHRARTKSVHKILCPMCPLAVLAEDALGKPIWNSDYLDFQKALGTTDMDAISRTIGAADSPRHPDRPALEEALL